MTAHASLAVLPDLSERTAPSAGWLRRLVDALIAVEARRRDAERIATMPEYLLNDIGISRDAVPSLARQLRSGWT